VYAVIDASADFNLLVQQVTIARLVAAGVVVTTWVAVLAELAHSTMEYGKYGSLLKEHVSAYGVAWDSFMTMSPAAHEVAALAKPVVKQSAGVDRTNSSYAAAAIAGKI